MKALIRNRGRRGFTLIELMIVVAIIGILAVLAIYGVSRYMKTAKTAEATNNIGAIQKNATEALTREKMSGSYIVPGGSAGLAYGFCPSELALVPAIAKVKGAKYVSGTTDWEAGKATNVGFYCLKFAVDQPQYYAYGYTATVNGGTTDGDAIDIIANGNLDGNAVTSEFKMHGQILTSKLIWAPKALETNPEE